MLNTQREIIDYCNEKGCSIADLVLSEELKNPHQTEESLRAGLLEVLEVMKNSSHDALEKIYTTRFKMIDGFAKTFNDYRKEKETICGDFLVGAMAMAFSTSETNAAMGKIAAAPTAGSAGIMPAAMSSMRIRYNLDDDTMIKGFLTSIGIGQIIGTYATFAGAEGGCQAECGSASAMAAAAIVEMLGGTPEMALNAASITLINVMGLVCDPIAGLVEYPCTFRNASGVMNAFISADMALAGVKSIVPFEETVQAMGEVGHMLHESLRETGLGGIAGTKTGQAIRREFLGDNA